MLKKIDIETKLGGIFAIIAIIAIIIEVAIAGFAREAVVAGIKDISETIVAVLVLVVAVRKLRPKKEIDTFESVVKKELNNLADRYEPLFSQANVELSDRDIRYNLITDFYRIFNYKDGDMDLKETVAKNNTGSVTGRFLEFSVDNPKQAKFHLNKSTFGKRGMSDDEWKNRAYQVSESIVSCIGRKFPEFCEAKKSGTYEDIIIIFKNSQGLSTIEEARQLAKLVEFVIMLYIMCYKKDV